MSVDVQGLTETPDPALRARRATELIDEYQAVVNELARVRREALEEMISQGMTQTQIAAQIGMTRSRVGQLLSSGPRPERALLGTGPVTVAMGGKFEADKDDPYAVVSTEMLAAYECLSTLARALGLKTDYEVVPPPGMVDLNRTNLIVMGSPRILPFVGQVIASDPKLGFGSDERGIHLINRETGEILRSPSDEGTPTDYAYLGRLPRPDGRGNFLYLAGIHAIGTLGAAQYLEEHLDDLYREVKNRRFSVLLACHYQPKSRSITRVEPITPIFRVEGVS